MYTEYKPHAALARWVECIWSIETGAGVRAYPVRPDACMDILYTPGVGLDVVGTMTTEQRFDLPAGARRIGLRFRPGMAPRFLRVDAVELRDSAVPLEAIQGRPVRDLRGRLDESRSAAEGGRILSAALLPPERPPDPVQLAIESMTRAHGDVDIDWLADQAGMSARQFRRRCLAESGFSPKHLARVMRFRRACDLAARGESWLRIAVEAGYFDQAHLIRDFREFTGSSPMSVFSKTPSPPIG